jgi:hypothetical protein
MASREAMVRVELPMREAAPLLPVLLPLLEEDVNSSLPPVPGFSKGVVLLEACLAMLVKASMVFGDVELELC